MINLRDKIEKLKNFVITDDLKSSFIADIKIKTIDKVLSILDQYNIITAPKSIKLSEIVSRLINTTENKFTIGRVQHFIVILFAYEPILRIDIPENKIGEILADCFDDTLNKWLCTLWIAGTEIIDDLECDE